jgi:hypothetical protein
MNGKEALEIIQSLKILQSPEDYGEFLKGEDSAKLRAFPEVAEFIKAKPAEEKEEKEETEEEKLAREKEEKEEKEEKPELKKAQDDVTLAETALAEKKAALEALQPAPAVTPVTSEMFKGLQSEINTKFSEVTKLITKSISPSDEVTELKKSVDNIVGIVEKIAKMPLGTKAIKEGVAANFFEKALAGESQDETGKQVLSVNINKDQVLKAMVDVGEKVTDPELKKAYEDSIMRYNAGGGTIEKAVAVDLHDNHDIRLVK